MRPQRGIVRMASDASRFTRPVAWAIGGALLVAASSTLGAQRSDTTVLRVAAPVHPGVATLVEELTLGNGMDAEEYRFSNAFVYGGRDGMVYVVDVSDPANVGDFRSIVRQYDRAGKLVRAFGRTGQGPGEYTGGVFDVQELPDGRVLLADPRGVLVYSATGEPLASWRAQASTLNSGSNILVDPAGFVSVYGRKPRDKARYLYRFRFDGTAVDTIPVPDATFPAPPIVGRVEMPFNPRYVTIWSPVGYFVTAVTSTYAIDLRVPPTATPGGGAPRTWRPGDPVRSIRHSIPAVRVQDAERDDWRQSITMFNRNARGEWPSWKWNGPDVPSMKPPIRNLHVDRSGRLWVELYQAAQLDRSVPIPVTPKDVGEIAARRRWSEPMVFDVLEPSGRYVGQVRFPDGVGKSPLGTRGGFTIQGDTVWAVSRGQDDVPFVKRYRIEWGR